ncbi:alpha/beta fold hydrolase [Deinococcus hohokamensis]|uniref:Alpha/beta fold hydrolase n=1 Tax=Deinococcus hohokamensis TaxID=309883 RepID=A0ABV9I5D5_9DEIO
MKRSDDMALLLVWFFGLLAVSLLGGGLWLVHAGLNGQGVGPLGPSAVFLIGLGLFSLALLGRFIVRRWLGCRTPPGTLAFAPLPLGTVQRLVRPDGAVLHVTAFGPEDAPVLLFTHGWELSGAEWFYAQQALAGPYRVVVWDLPGLGRSTGPRDQAYDLTRLAGHLQAVIEATGPQPVILAGHSIGGMVILTWCREAQASLLNRVAGLVLSHTTPTNPLRTTWGAQVLSPLERVLVKPMCRLTIALSPLVRVMNALAYLSGLTHLSNHLFQFAGRETREQLDFVSRSGLRANPVVSARGMLAMLRYDARDVLPTLPMPVLVVGGDVDKVTLPAASEYMRREIPQARAVRLAPAGHLGLLEQHGAWTQAVRDFARNCFDPGLKAAPAATSPRRSALVEAGHEGPHLWTEGQRWNTGVMKEP